jgi:signal transduction histidine kinase
MRMTQEAVPGDLGEDSSAAAMRQMLEAVLAMRDGDFSVRLPGHWTGMEGKLADALNEVLLSNQRAAEQLVRVSKVVGQEGKTRPRVRLPRSVGGWADMEEAVNALIDDLLWPTAEMTRVLSAVAHGDLTQAMRLEIEGRPLQGELLRSATIVNAMIDQLGALSAEVTRVAREVGSEGKLGGRAEVPEVRGVWRQLTDSVNSMAGNVTAQARHISEITHAVARGDLSKKIIVEAHGEILQLKETINTMVDQLRAFVAEVTRVAREVGTEGKLGSHARVPGVAGAWKEVTDGVNAMIDDLRVTTGRKQAQQRELEETNAQLALTSRYKSEFLANMSHELRTPLNSILLLGHQLSENVTANLTAKQLDAVRTICGAGSDLLHLITDILDLSKIESGTVTVEPTEVLFGTLLDALSRQFRHEAERRGLFFEISLDPSLGRSLVTDQKRLQQVLTNLLANAFKFTSSGGVRLVVFRAAAGWEPEQALGRSGDALAFEVSDTGIGIAPEKQGLVFEAFQQADAGTSRKYGGTGLGLAISRDLSILLGGELRLRSTPGVGSAFTLLLPLAQSEAPGAADDAERQGRWRGETSLLLRRPEGELSPEHQAKLEQVRRSHEELRGRKVMVVDDDVRNIFALSSVLERYGVEVVPAQSGREAVALLRETDDIAAVLMDIMMPEQDGYQTIQIIRREPARRLLPVIALTARAMKGDREKCLEAGASDYLAKPVDPDQLLDTLRLWLPR